MQTLFNFLSCTAVATAQNMSAGNALHATFMIMGAHAVILPMLIYVFMPVSGAHFNPMVTMSMVAAGRQVRCLLFATRHLRTAKVAAERAGELGPYASGLWHQLL